MKLSSLFVTTAFSALVLLSVGALVLSRFRSKLYWQRWLTWFAISISFSVSYLVGQTCFNVLVCLVAFVMMFELISLLKLDNFSTTLVLLATWIDFFEIIQGRSAAVFFWLIPVMMFVLNLTEAQKGRKLESAVVGMYGSLLISLSFVQLVQYPDRSLALILAVACFDVAAFIGGKSLGKLPMLKLHFTPKTSPNKTLAGLVTGSVALLIVLLVLGKLTLLSFGLVVVGAVLGDYLESLVKRFAGVKDAGSWLPGFGGLLDRFDSLILLAPLALFIF
jgi:phosphatidate cytidylyltransferase